MSYLDSLENNLKALESREEKDPGAWSKAQREREAQRNAAIKAAPVVDALKSGPFTSALLTACRAIGFASRTLVRFTWLEDVLRLEAKDKRLELHPSAEGVRALFFVNGEQTASESVDLNGNAEKLAKRWLE